MNHFFLTKLFKFLAVDYQNQCKVMIGLEVQGNVHCGDEIFYSSWMLFKLLETNLFGVRIKQCVGSVRFVRIALS